MTTITTTHADGRIATFTTAETDPDAVYLIAVRIAKSVARNVAAGYVDGPSAALEVRTRMGVAFGGYRVVATVTGQPHI